MAVCIVVTGLVVLFLLKIVHDQGKRIKHLEEKISPPAVKSEVQTVEQPAEQIQQSDGSSDDTSGCTFPCGLGCGH